MKKDKFDWDNWFLGLADYIATASKDPSTKVGAVIIDQDKRIVSMGYNGFPRGIEDSDERLNNRDVKYKMIIHAEANAILFATKSLENCTLYTTPIMPCAACASMIIQKGIKRVVSTYSENSRWIEQFKLSEKIFAEAGVGLTLIHR
jgi:dCMP deaminase